MNNCEFRSFYFFYKCNLSKSLAFNFGSKLKGRENLFTLSYIYEICGYEMCRIELQNELSAEGHKNIHNKSQE